MSDHKKDSSWFQSFDLKKTKGKKLNMKYLVVLLIIGVMFMMIGNLLKPNEEPSFVPTMNTTEEEQPSSEVFKSDDRLEEHSTMSEYEAFYEQQLQKVLEDVAGLSNVSVIVNLAETERTVYQVNQNTKEQITDETDREGGTRKVEDRTKEEQVVTVRSGDKEEPLVEKVEKPEIRGVLIVANGVENIQLKSLVIEAVSKVLDVPSHRVSVLPKKLKEES
ncbi:stage III sporulation protein AG [Evansella caseinilytica]|uniref:Stage III sporulation protein AG n=1 Tax=Evansella caseinilytica TaxID=1503961 RepID=A0A1H3KX57_9BACI|nr:stage III sporulation protein AG [Evansella caseinilytica]SDY56308.1 stage III sporulation protein AG [Evansella caseinilytica]